MAVPKNKPAKSFPVQPFVVPPQVRIGHVRLKVADLERALRFYPGVLGFEITQRFGNGAVFLSFSPKLRFSGLGLRGTPHRHRFAKS
jgi:catechol-2,3-dioxygenase